ncbi:MAG: hypothetical protein WD037_10735 [Balneolales bacterium]
MANKNNKKDPLERFFQKKAGEYDIQFREDDWRKLENKLDYQNLQKTYRSRVRWIAAASILIFSILGYYTFDNHNRINQMGQQLNDEISPYGLRGTEELLNIDDRPEEEKLSNEALDVDLSTDSDHIESQTYASDDQPVNPIPIKRNNQREFTKTENHSSGEVSKREETRLIAKREPPPPSRFTMPGKTTEYSTIGDTRGLHRPDENLKMAARQTHPRIAAGFVMTPDLSTVGSLSNFYNPGYKIGATFEYHLSSNLFITTGIMQSKVRYLATGGEYHPSVQGYGASTPEETIGECLLFDIPINLKYNFLNFSRSRLFATVGLSSYIMLNEDYRFRYKDNGNQYEKSWSGNTGTSHLMSNTGLSIGYELDIRPNWSLRAEPFIRAPLRKVGRGNVKLYSIGSFISFTYKFSRG